MVKIFINEKEFVLPDNTKIVDVQKQFNPTADMIIMNGYPVNEQDIQKEVQDGDHLVLIRKGEIPSQSELESVITARHTPGVYEKVKKAVVGIAGLGGLGSNVAISLARIGIGKLILVDYDIVEPSNINRQQYFLQHIGMYKTEVMKQIIHSINPYINVVIHTTQIEENNVYTLFSDVDILVEAFDSDVAKRMLIESFQKYCPRKPIISASGMAGYYSSNIIKVRKVTPYFYIVGDEINSAQQRIGLMAPRVGIVANMQANTVLRIIMGEDIP